MTDETRAFLQGLSDGNLYQIPFGRSNDILLMICEDGSLEFSGFAKCPFEEELLQKAVVVLGDSVFQFFSKAAIVAYFLNSRHPTNMDEDNSSKPREEWKIFYYSGYGS
jgi:hypothetical protein